MKKPALFLLLLVALPCLLFSQNVKEYYITCDPDDYAMIYERFNEVIYIPATFTYGTTTWKDVRIRIRGDGTRGYPKKSIKISFDGDPFSNGRDELNLNADYLDKTYMRTYLSSRLMSEAGIKCFDAEHVRLFVNGEYAGLYVSIENVTADYLESRGYDRKGNLYKASTDGSCLSIFDDVYAYYWEKKTNKNKSREDLAILIDSLNHVPDNQYYDLVHRLFNYDEMINIICMNMLIANGSTYSHNYFMYHDIRRSGKWTMLPWDLDKTFGYYWYNFSPQQSSGPGVPDNPFLERAILNERIHKDIEDRIDVLAATIFNKEHIFPIMDSLIQVLRPSVIEDDKDNVADTSVWMNDIGIDRAHVSARYGNLVKRFANSLTSFEVDRTNGTYTGDVKLKWHPAKSPIGSKITYNLHYTRNMKLTSGTNTIIEGIDDTTYTLTGLEEGRYYWMIVGFDGKYVTEGTDNFNFFDYRIGSQLPCQITENTTLTKGKSPYIIDCKVNISGGAMLKIEPGVELHFLEGGSISSNGPFVFAGSESEPIIIKSLSESPEWNYIKTEKSNTKCVFSNIEIQDVKIGVHLADADFENVNFKLSKELTGILVLLTNADFSVSNCKFIGSDSGEGLIVADGTAVVEGNEFKNILDPLEFVRVKSGVIRNNFISNSIDDGIDINSSNNVDIIGNRIINVGDNGITIGNVDTVSSLNIKVIRNVIAESKKGISVKSGSKVYAANNTLYGNKTSLLCFEKIQGTGGGELIIENTIISGTIDNMIYIDPQSTIDISYSLSDTEPLPGDNNINANPMFADAAAYDFHLQSGSPAINAGNPASPKDTDGSVSDIGAFSVNLTSYNIVINEINYNSSADFNPGDWVEFYNPADFSVNVSGWYFSDSDDTHKFFFPDGYEIPAFGYVVLCKDLKAFQALFPNVTVAIGDMGFGLSGAGELIRLFNSQGILIDSVQYDDTAPWPEPPDGKGPTLELIHPSLDNALAESWKASYGNGTPGRQNGKFTGVGQDYQPPKDNISAYPNPFEESTEVTFEIFDTSYVIVEIYNSLGMKIREIANELMEPGIYRRRFDALQNAQGTYYCTMNVNGEVSTFPIVHLKQ